MSESYLQRQKLLQKLLNNGEMRYMKQKQKMLKLLTFTPLFHAGTLFLHTGHTKLQ